MQLVYLLAIAAAFDVLGRRHDCTMRVRGRKQTRWTSNAGYVAYCTPINARLWRHGMKSVSSAVLKWICIPVLLPRSVGISWQRLHFAFMPGNSKHLTFSNMQSYLFNRVWTAVASGYTTERLRPTKSRQTMAVVGVTCCLCSSYTWARALKWLNSSQMGQIDVCCCSGCCRAERHHIVFHCISGRLFSLCPGSRHRPWMFTLCFWLLYGYFQFFVARYRIQNSISGFPDID